MIHCDEALELISASLDGELTVGEQLLLDDHLVACADCRALLDDFSTIHTTLSRMNAPVPADLVGGVMERIAAEKVIPMVRPSSQKRRWKSWTATVAVFAVILLGAHTLGKQSLVAPAELSGQGMEDVLTPTEGNAAAPPERKSQLPEHADTGPILGEADDTSAPPSEPPQETQESVYNDPSLSSAPFAKDSHAPTAGTLTPKSTPAPFATPLTPEAATPNNSTSPNPLSQPEVLSMEESLDILLGYLGWSNYTLDADGSTILGEADADGTVPVLTYLSLSENEQYYIFELHQRTADATTPFSGSSQTTLTSCYALPLDGGDIVQGVGASFYDALNS